MPQTKFLLPVEFSNQKFHHMEFFISQKCLSFNRLEAA